MLYEGIEFGLRVEPFRAGKWGKPMHNPSMNWFWRIMEYLPIPRLSYRKETGDKIETW